MLTKREAEIAFQAVNFLLSNLDEEVQDSVRISEIELWGVLKKLAQIDTTLEEKL